MLEADHGVERGNAVAAAIDAAEEVFAQQKPEKPRLLVENFNPDITVSALRDILAQAEGLYDRGMPVRLAFDQIQKGIVAQPLTPHSLVRVAHGWCRPYSIKKGEEVNVRLPQTIAMMYLDWRGDWDLPPLNGIASAPLLLDDGTINSAVGYEPKSGMWCEDVPDLTGLIPKQPTRHDAQKALQLIRKTFRTFCFADAHTLDEDGVSVVDMRRAPGRDESSFLAALLTAVCRPSLHLAPGVLLRAAPLSGAGAGKGLLARCICTVAFGRDPHAVTGGATAEELEKRIAAELIEGSPALFLDNLNYTAFKSDLLASAITERPARVRLLGKSQMVPLNASAFVILTGNGLTVSEDLARRFLTVEFDPCTEDPEGRVFKTDIHAEVRVRRTEILAALLTIWRWGRIATDLEKGRALGSFEQWCSWVRDPLLALDCEDPADRVTEAKARDSGRQTVAELFTVWWDKHRGRPVQASGLDRAVEELIDPQGRGRQYITAYLGKRVGTRIGGFKLTRQQASGKWGVATYALIETSEGDNHRGHRGDGNPPADCNIPF